MTYSSKNVVGLFVCSARHPLATVVWAGGESAAQFSVVPDSNPPLGSSAAKSTLFGILFSRGCWSLSLFHMFIENDSRLR
jgi:uncharacterized membrane protein